MNCKPQVLLCLELDFDQISILIANQNSLTKEFKITSVKVVSKVHNTIDKITNQKQSLPCLTKNFKSLRKTSKTYFQSSLHY